MTNPARRITLVLGKAECSTHRWQMDNSQSRMIFVPKFALLLGALHSGFSDLSEDVARVILDGCASVGEFLDLLASLPHGFLGDVVFVSEEGSGFISAIERGGDRVLNAFTATDLDFYLQTHGLLAGASMGSSMGSGMSLAIPQSAGKLAIVAAA